MDIQNQNSLTYGITLTLSQNKTIARTNNLNQNACVTLSFVTDNTGQLIASNGDQKTQDLVALGALIAGDLAASREIARQTCQYEAYQTIIREGQKTCTFICDAGRDLVLMVQVSNDVPLGWARMLVKKAAKQLACDCATTREETADATEEEKTSPDMDFSGDQNLSDLFDDALDDLWQG